jgi:hypothetical protein
VAMTRAVNELYAFIPSKAGNSQNIVGLLIPEECRACGAPVVETKIKTAAEERLKLPFVAHKDWIGFLREEFVDLSSGRRDLRRRGEAMHFLLSFVRKTSKAHLDEAMESARREGSLAFPLVADWDELEKDVRALVHEPKLKPFFDADHDKVFCELEVIDAWAETRRIDRLMVSPDGVDVIDFKSSREGEEGHRRQVEDYIELVKGLYPGLEVRGWLIYLNDRSLEAVAKS